MIRPRKLPSTYGPSSVLGALAGISTWGLVSKVLCNLPLPSAIPNWDQHLFPWIALRLHGINPGLFSEIAARYQQQLDFSGLPAWQITARFDMAAIVGIASAAAVTYFLGRPQPDTIIDSERHLFEGKVAHRKLRKLAAKECKVSGQGLKLHPDFDWHLSIDRERRHFLITGSVGGGKTQAILPLCMAAINRKDKVLIFDIKGDFTSVLPGGFALLAPWDGRSMVWDVSKDVLNAQDSRQLAAQLIPPGNDPMWHQAARQILSAIIQHLQCTKPLAWTWNDLLLTASLSQEKLLDIVRIYAPEAENLLAGESKTTDGILINLSASLAIVSDLAAAWGNALPDRYFSISEWLLNSSPKYRTVVLQGNGRYAELTRGYVKGMISMLAGRVNSAEFSDDKSRHIFIALDEFPQLCVGDGEIGHKVGGLIEIGRSKGLTVLVGAQDLNQVRQSMGQYAASTWGSMIGTQIICRVNPGDTAQWFSKDVIGYATIKKTIVHEGKLQPVQIMQQLLMEPSDMSDYLGPHKHGVKAALLGFGHVFILDWPYTTLPKLRDPMVPAAWTLSVKPKSPTNKNQQQQRETQMNEKQKQPRLVLRAPTRDEILDMAESGTDMRHAAESMDEMTPDTPPAPQTGGDRE